jgi:hypothetical protein
MRMRRNHQRTTVECSTFGNLRARSSEDVFEDHLRLAGEYQLEEDSGRDVSPDCVVLERRIAFRGHDGCANSPG